MVMCHIDCETPAGKELRKKFSVRGLPTTILLTADGAEVDRILGYPGRGEYLKTFLGYLYGVDTLEDILARSKAEPSPELLAEVASKYLGRGNSKEALVWAAKAREEKGEKPGELLRRLDLLQGQAWLETEPAKGEAALRKIVIESPAKDPTGAEAFSELSRYYKKTKKDDAALLSLYNDLLPKRGEEPEFLNDYAWTFAENGTNLDKALEVAKRAVELSKDDPGILDTLAEVYFKKGDAKSAVATIEKAIAKKPDDDYFKKQKAKFLGTDKPKSKG
jgi:tetratricopeptide (TPR) repeat protein